MTREEENIEYSVSSEEIEEWNDEHDEPHSVFTVKHRPERIELEFEGDDNE